MGKYYIAIFVCFQRFCIALPSYTEVWR